MRAILLTTRPVCTKNLYYIDAVEMPKLAFIKFPDFLLKTLINCANYFPDLLECIYVVFRFPDLLECIYVVFRD